MQNEPSAVEIYFNKCAENSGSNRRFKDLNPLEVVQLIQSINVLLSLLWADPKE